MEDVFTAEEVLLVAVLLLVAGAAVLVARGLPMLMALPLVNRLLLHPITWRYQAVMYWGGLRGAMALAMVLSLDHGFEDRELLLDMTFGVVLFTLFVQGLSIRPLVNMLGLQKFTLGEQFERRSAVLLSQRNVAQKIESLQTRDPELARRFGWERYPAGKVVFLQGNYGSDFHVIRRGQARVTVATAAGKRQDRVLEEGNFFGELALLGDSTRHASIRADTDMKTLTIKEDVFRNLLESLPGTATRIAQAQSHYVDGGPPLTRPSPGDA
ncbi:MAG: cyclic nucleotide-binding domain-containing protein [Chloroflexota bacterium]|jgi:NhaP-type Na+/H+ or K+/H+ antiporter|nr:cyclic nucleotide-binding domain-containing protein [Chloroflexota bacterium]MDP6508024.1 cyclic nucleotide-binding domain-containing protein [Chloroflexota bacterium]MDP6758091.1 cyclic nucleotide-binding domain-containing protein [Chloroflexota bacterium]